MMPPFSLRPLLGVLLCLLLALDAVGAAAAAVRGLGGGCTHAQTANAAMTMPTHRHGAHSARDVSAHAHEAVATHASDRAMRGSHQVGETATQDVQARDTHARDAHAHHGHLAAADPPQDSPTTHHPATAPGDDGSCDDGGCDNSGCNDGSCACPAACSLALASPAFPALGARAPEAMSAGLPQHTRPAPPQPDALRPPIG